MVYGVLRGGFGEGAGFLAALDGGEDKGSPVVGDVQVGGVPGRAGLDAVGVLE
jgi:hypothetical protein